MKEPDRLVPAAGSDENESAAAGSSTHRFLVLLRGAWPAVLSDRHDEVKRLGHALGDHHDLCVLQALLLEDPASFAQEDTMVTFLNLLQQEHAQLERQARRVGGLLFAEKPAHLVHRFGVYLSSGLAPA